MRNLFENISIGNQVNNAQEKEKSDTVPENKEEQKPDKPASEATPEDKKEKERLLEKYTQGLSTLYKLLPHDKRIDNREYLNAVEQTTLRDLPGTAKRELGIYIFMHKWNAQPEAEFVKNGLEKLSLLIHAEALVKDLKEKTPEMLKQMLQEKQTKTGETPEGPDSPMSPENPQNPKKSNDTESMPEERQTA
jgi:hypothetical protein